MGMLSEPGVLVIGAVGLCQQREIWYWTEFFSAMATASAAIPKQQCASISSFPAIKLSGEAEIYPGLGPLLNQNTISGIVENQTCEINGLASNCVT